MFVKFVTFVIFVTFAKFVTFDPSITGGIGFVLFKIGSIFVLFVAGGSGYGSGSFTVSFVGGGVGRSQPVTK